MFEKASIYSYSLKEVLNINRSNSLRYINWKKKYPERDTPLVLDMREYKDIKQNDMFFCRKIQPVISTELIRQLKKDINDQKQTSLFQ